MAKININFNNTDYSIDDSALVSATAELKTHLSTVMNGEGATINLDGTAYNVDSAKLEAATNDLISHLGTIAGSGSTVAIGGAEYSVDSSKISSAISGLEATFGSLEEEKRLEGDGAEFFTLAPTALTFRSTAPLNEFQEVQINGQTVNPSNYTLEEGSTIVTFPIDYLKTLDTGNYEVDVVSNSKSVKGNFTITAPALNEYGFYYNQPYYAYMDYFNSDVVIVIREDNTVDIAVVAHNATETNTYTVDEGILTITSQSMGELHFTISEGGMKLYNVELGVTLSVNENTTYVADKNCLYMYQESLGGYRVHVIDKLQTSYIPIKTGIYGIPTVSIADYAFNNCSGLTSITIPDSVTSIGEQAFSWCNSLTNINIPDGVTTIGKQAFSWCNSLTSINIPDSVIFIGKQAFEFCKSLIKVDITDIGAWCDIEFSDSASNPLYYAKDLYINGELVTNINIPHGVIKIGDYAFHGHSSLENITLPESVTSIGNYAFQQCTNLTSINIPDSITSINKGTFSQCANLTSINIPDSVTSIGYEAFSSSGLTSITIPNSVTSISERTFFGCRNLSSITIPDSVTSIGNDAFASCNSLTSITIPDSVTSMGGATFERCSNLTSITISDSVTSIGASTFLECSSLGSITIPDSVTSIGNNAFYECKSLKSITFNGTIAQWNSISFGKSWNSQVPATYVQCSDGIVNL